jgi:hypothetical protein
MATILQDIQTVRSLRKSVRDPKVPPNVLKAIENIHHCIKSGTDTNGWKKVEWRGQATTTRPTTSNMNASHATHATQKNGNYFGNRSGNESHQPAAYNYNNRSRNGFSNQKESLASIPLSGPVAAVPVVEATQATQVTETDNFEVVRRGNTWQEKSDGFRPQKYVSKFKKTSDKVEDTILNTILLGKLNKFSQPNYNEIKEFITHIIDSGQTDMIKCFMKLVFEKAASEEVFCPLYAKLLSELSSSYPVLLTEMANLYNQYMEIFEEVADGKGENYTEMCKRNVEKKYRRGYSQFLAELIKHNIIDTETFMKSITTIIQQVERNATIKDSIKLNEEFADCLMKIMKAIKVDKHNEDADVHTMIQTVRGILKNDMSVRICPLSVCNSENIGISNKARFTFLGIYEDIQKL